MALGIAEEARRMKQEELLLLMGRRGWPACDMRTIGASASLARHGVIGPGREAWEAFCSWADSRQMNHVTTMAIHNPALFVGSNDNQHRR